MADSENPRKRRWAWPLGLLATAVAGLGVVVFRGCWHRKMSWPVRAGGNCYQVCTGCGIKRLFDEELFRAYGPYSYDLDQLSAWRLAQRGVPEIEPEVTEPEVTERRPAS